ncbi:mechanosensitive ion channel domain-containing protein [Flavobacterium sp.]|uniref:mechanosensitive ion channel family protein n=1 Tax=Flavobacterium sp. TaxID=239 RepID=UPI0026287AB9|nr:mechanosensitive ion channel domain-containing protein [Flavobacterium sp.]MDD2986935.1 mechanosensitive ion channel [Flavobacterium sp.]
MIHEFLNYEILKVGSRVIYMVTLLKLLLFIFSVIFVLFIVKKAIYRSNRIDTPKKYSIFNLLKYLILVIAASMGMQIVGFDLSVLLAGSAALLVGIGLGLQHIFSDFVSGILILLESTVKVGDIIEINGLVSQVVEIKLRTTTVLTREDKYIILPNSDLTRNQLINWTHDNISSRFEVQVGVDYSSDVNEVMRILYEVTLTQEGIEKEPKPFVRFINFGDSSLDFLVIFWSEEVFRVHNIKSELRVKIFNAFREHKISIPFPQRVIHFKKDEEI